LKLGDDISTDEIMPAGARVLPYRSNIPAMADYAFDIVDDTYPERARAAGEHFVVGGDNYGQGSSREHAAIVPRYLGLRAVLAKGIARIHWQNLVNFAVLPLTFTDPGDYDRIDQGDVLAISDPAEQLWRGNRVEVVNETKGVTYSMRHHLSPRQIEIVARGSLISVIRDRQQT
jgi:aconitate hydratase